MKGELVTSLKTANASAVKQPLFPLPPTAAEQSMSTSNSRTHTHAHPSELRPLAHPLVCRSFRFNASLLGISNAAAAGSAGRHGGREGGEGAPAAAFPPSGQCGRLAHSGRKNVMHLCLAFVSRCLYYPVSLRLPQCRKLTIFSPFSAPFSPRHCP